MAATLKPGKTNNLWGTNSNGDYVTVKMPAVQRAREALIDAGAAWTDAAARVSDPDFWTHNGVDVYVGPRPGTTPKVCSRCHRTVETLFSSSQGPLCLPCHDQAE